MRIFLIKLRFRLGIIAPLVYSAYAVSDWLSIDDACVKPGCQKSAEGCSLATLQLSAIAGANRGVGDIALPPTKAGASVQLDQAGYKAVAELQSDTEMADFIHRTVNLLGGVVTNDHLMKDFVAFYSGTRAIQSYHRLLSEIRSYAKLKNSWVVLPPPEVSTVAYQMIRPDKWNCDLLPPGDSRANSCRKDVQDLKELRPESVKCGGEGNPCSIEHANAFRASYAVGALPCCRSGSFCAAPACSTNLIEQRDLTCTTRSATENLAYMKRPDVWPAYHGWGGAFELDTLKYLDLLGCHEGSEDPCPGAAFDVALDLGANVGYFTEKLTVRHMANNYLLVEANGATAKVIQNRWADDAWKYKWFKHQVPQHRGAWIPQFEVLNFALSNASHGRVNMCQTEASMSYSPSGCYPESITVDEIIAKRLSPKFQDIFVQAQSAFIKVDTEGMDELVMKGMKNLLKETRGHYKDGRPRYLVNFMQFEFAPALMEIAKKRQNFAEYDIKTATKFLASVGFESFLIGPRFLPISHESWDDEYKTFTADPDNNPGMGVRYPSFETTICPWCVAQDTPSFTSDILAIRKSHPRSTEIKLALGACQESKDFNLADKQYEF